MGGREGEGGDVGKKSIHCLVYVTSAYNMILHHILQLV